MSWLTKTSTLKAEAFIKQTLSVSEDPHNIFTPFALCDEVVGKIPSLEGKILVVANLELLYTMMSYGVDTTLLYFATPCTIKAQVAKTIIPESNVIMYTKVITKEDVGDMKFDAVVANPPYNKNENEPLYYEFMRQFSTLTDGPIRVIVPIGWLVGPKARNFREYILDTFNISRIEYITNERFNGEILQPTIIVDMQVGATTQFEFVRTANKQVYSTTVTRDNDIFDLGMPLYVNDKGKELIQAARRFNATFETKTGEHEGPCVHLGPVNQSTYYLSSMPINWYVRNIIVKVQASKGVDNKSRVFHRCSNMDDANNLRLWMNSAGARMVVAMWATSYRNTGSNVGQVPVVIVDGEYSNMKAYKKLGLSKDTIEWLLELDHAHTKVL